MWKKDFSGSGRVKKGCIHGFGSLSQSTTIQPQQCFNLEEEKNIVRQFFLFLMPQ